MTGEDELRRRRLRQLQDNLERAGYRTTPPPDDQADAWALVVHESENDAGLTTRTPRWLPRIPSEAFHRARLPPDTADAAVEHDG